MPKPVVKVAVNGFGTIGKRVAGAIARQDDMRLLGIADISPNYRIKLAAKAGYDVYAATLEAAEEMRRGGLELAGTLEDLLKEVDVVIDCAPAGIGAKNKNLYERVGTKAVFEGGEKASIAQSSFVASCNYEEALGKDYVRVVSCNTTALCRTLNALRKRYGLKKVRSIIVRRGADPPENKAGPINAIVPDRHLPSHHAEDVKTVLSDLNITTMACKTSTTLSHLHFVIADPAKPLTREEALEAFKEEPRITIVSMADGLDATSSVIELMRDLGRLRADMYEVAVFEELVSVLEGEVYFVMQVGQEAIVVPENVDCIRAVTELEENGAKSIEKTDRSLGVLKEFY
jgi:glyceraldehyde-3-phosphate dehydrogenase (NAD(P))